MATQTILVRFRAVTDMNTDDVSDADFTAGEDYVLDRFNAIMDEALTITSHTTTDSVADEILVYLAATYWYKELRKGKLGSSASTYLLYEEWEQEAFKLMYERNPSRMEMIKMGGDSFRYIPRDHGRYKSYKVAVGYDNDDETWNYDDTI